MKQNSVGNANCLVILSLPFQRLIRSHLSPVVLDIIATRADLVVVSPFGADLNFVSQYNGKHISHLVAPTHEKLPWLFRKLVAISSILRRQGYWRRVRSHLPYFWANRHVEFGENGNDTVVVFWKRLITEILAWAGSRPWVWSLLDSMIGRWSFHMSELTALANTYDRVTLVQAASWGFQDQALAWCGRKNQWRTVLLPYTTDQLMTNGYLYSDFDVVCVQGEVERRFAEVLHNVPDHKIFNVGSIYMRALEAIGLPTQFESVSSDILDNRIMYAGLVPTYFPADYEIQAVNMLSKLELGDGKKITKFIYRPASLSQEYLASVKAQLLFPDRVELQTTSSTSLGLESYSPTNSTVDLQNLITNLKNVDVMVTSLTTSLSVEAALLGVPSIAYYPEESAFFCNRNVRLLCNAENRTIGLESIPVASNLQELESLVKQLLNDPVLRKKITDATLREWDYPKLNYQGLLERAVFGH